MTSKNKNLSIYGSCVSRDTVSFCNSDTITLRRYIARQSLISAFTLSPEINFDLSALGSDFQKRMVLGDLERTLATTLPAIAKDSDLLLWDLVDERLGVYLFDDGSVITRSLELINSGAEEQVQTKARFIAFGTDSHFHLWVTALEEFIRTLDSAGLRSRVRLLDIPWATKDTNGRRIRPSMGTEAKTANSLYRRYFDVAAHTIRTVPIGNVTEPRGSASHQWGLAPFHYEERVYQEIASALGLPT